jgi:tetratricopeptide (TPR) repeat protein
MCRHVFRLVLAALIALAPANLHAQARAGSSDADAAYYFLLARHLESIEKVGEAIAALHQAITIAPGVAEIRAELAGLYARQDKPIEALNTAEDALKLDPNNREANRVVGLIMGVLAEQDKALRPGDDPAQYPARAMAALEKARETGDLNVLLSLGRLQLRAGQHEKAVASLRRIVDEQPQFTEGALLMSAAQEGTGKLDDAIGTLEMALKVNPRSFRVLLQLTELYERQYRWKDAASGYERAAAANPRADLTYRRAAALMNSGASREARDLLESSIAKRKIPDAALLYLLADSQRRMKQFDAAIATAQKLREAYPQDARGLLIGAQVNVDRGQRLDEAVRLLESALRSQPGNPSMLDSLGSALLKQGNLDGADKPLTEAAAQLPGSSAVQDHLGDLRFRQARYAEAVDAWERALKGDGEETLRVEIGKKLRDARTRLPK